MSMSNLIVEIGSTAENSILQAVSISIDTLEDGQIQVLNNHEEKMFNFEKQTITVDLGEGKINFFAISGGMINITQSKEGRTKAEIVVYGFQKVLNFDNSFDNDHKYIIELNRVEAINNKSKDLVEKELVPSLSQAEQESRDVEASLRKEFEKSL